MLAVIFANSVALTQYDYTDRLSLTDHNQMLDNLNIFFMLIYIWEALLKSIAYGFVINKRAYLRDSWNKMDFFVVVTG